MRYASLVFDWCLSLAIQLNLRAGFPKLVSLKAKVSKTLFGPIKPTNPSVWMAYKGQSSLGITAILYTYRACKTLFGPIKSTNPSVRMANNGQISFGKSGRVGCYTFCVFETLPSSLFMLVPLSVICIAHLTPLRYQSSPSTSLYILPNASYDSFTKMFTFPVGLDFTRGSAYEDTMDHTPCYIMWSTHNYGIIHMVSHRLNLNIYICIACV